MARAFWKETDAPTSELSFDSTAGSMFYVLVLVCLVVCVCRIWAFLLPPHRCIGYLALSWTWLCWLQWPWQCGLAWGAKCL
jgi:hypothetical protein